MLIGDGVTPGNEGRGYVLRRMHAPRRSATMRLLGATSRRCPSCCRRRDRRDGRRSTPSSSTDWRADLDGRRTPRRTRSAQTLRAGHRRIFDVGRGRGQAGRRQPCSPATQAFQLHDTYGFPIDLTLEMAAEQGLPVDEDGLPPAHDRSSGTAPRPTRAAKKTGHADVVRLPRDARRRPAPIEFTGYDEVVDEGTVRGLLAGGAPSPAAGEGDEVEVVLDRTPFYAEGGGQLADQGVITLANGAVRRGPRRAVADHRPDRAPARVVAGEVTRRRRRARREVDIERRRAISRAHTATHMVHKAFREALGETATQAGSENAPGRFRFDFSATGAVPASVLARRRAAGQRALARRPRRARRGHDARTRRARSGAMALFGEKYGDEVRVVSVGDWARELCGGTHAGSSGQLGVVKLLGESSIGAGVRRVEALVGIDAYRFLAREHVLVAQLTEPLKARPEELPDRVADLRRELRDAEKEIERIRRRPAAGRRRPTLAAGASDVDGVAVRRATGADGAAAATCASWRSTCAAGSRRPPGRRRGHRRRRRQGLGRGRGQRRRPRARACRPTRWSGPPRRTSTAAAAARTTSPRAAAPTPPGSTRRSRPSMARCPRR